MPKREIEEPASKKTSLHTMELTTEQVEKVKRHCDYYLWEFFHVDYSTFAARNKAKGVVVTAYPPKKPGRPAKLVISGKGTEDFIQEFIEPEVTKEARFGYDEVWHPEWYEAHAGLDEAGKGDVFGPLVCATVIADEEAVRALVDAGVKDSKALGDASIIKIDAKIRKTKGVTVKTAYCSMERYNELMAKPAANLNKLLAWLHSKALTAALAEQETPWGLLDQFSKTPLVQQQLKKDGVKFDLRMQTKAEADPVVAAASIVARAEFVRQVKKLSDAVGEELHLGAGPQVKAQGKKLVEKHGPEVLGKVAKLHFKTCYEILGLPVPVKKVWVGRPRS